MVLKIASDRGDEVTIDACQRMIDDDCDGGLPAQSDLNTVFMFLDHHVH
jgi:hypothetical protein